ncbi:MAG: hypothetical protein RRA94_03555 [Bacteroidota bacterium]|nr:hypothetical protein [Bacteroidota bacterium]
MKLLPVLLCALLFPFTAAAQDVPSNVEISFSKKFAAAGDVVWDVTEDGTYLAMFLLDGRDMSALFNEEGAWLSSTTYIDQDEIPGKVQSTVAKQFPDYEMYDVARVETPGGVYFEALLESETDALLLHINADGKVLKREAVAVDSE